MSAQLHHNAVGSGVLKEPCIRRGSRSSHANEQFLAERTCPGMTEDTLRELCKNRGTDQDAIWFLVSGWPNDAGAMRPYVKLLLATYAIARPSVVCLSSVCNARAPYSGGSDFPQYFYGIRYLGHPWTSTENFTETSQGNPSAGGVEHKRGSKI